MKHISEVKIQVVVPCEHCEGTRKGSQGLPCRHCLGVGTQHMNMPIREFALMMRSPALKFPEPEILVPVPDPEDATT